MEAASYHRPWWYRGRHLQTLWGPLLRRFARVPLRRERVHTPDGDFLDLDWVDVPPARAPLVLILHGLEGSSRSHYVSGLLKETVALGLRGVVLNFRSCSGELNRAPRLYHSGETSDLDRVIGRLLQREPSLRLGLVGVSLGGNVALKWLGERGEAAPGQVAAAVAISTPYDLAACAGVLDRGLPRALYTRQFLRTLKAKVRAKARLYDGRVDRRRAAGAHVPRVRPARDRAPPRLRRRARLLDAVQQRCLSPGDPATVSRDQRAQRSVHAALRAAAGGRRTVALARGAVSP